MAGEHLKNITPEQRAEMLEKSKQSRGAKRQWAEGNLKLHWDDHSHWQDLASKYGYRLPNRYEKCSSKHTNRFLKQFGLSREWYTDVTGFKNANEEFRVNPSLPAFAACGMLLEQYNEDMEELK